MNTDEVTAQIVLAAERSPAGAVGAHVWFQPVGVMRRHVRLEIIGAGERCGGTFSKSGRRALVHYLEDKRSTCTSCEDLLFHHWSGDWQTGSKAAGGLRGRGTHSSAPRRLGRSRGDCNSRRTLNWGCD
jgi:hypothetical protein